MQGQSIRDTRHRTCDLPGNGEACPPARCEDCVPSARGAQMELEHLLRALTVATVLDDDRRPASRDCGDQVRAPLGRLSTQDLGRTSENG